MAQKFDYPKSEQELRELQDTLYRLSQMAKQGGHQPSFKGLLEIMRSEVVILTAIHNIKSNKGAQTPGSDGETMRTNILERDYEYVIQRVQDLFGNYQPLPVRRKWIPKEGKMELRPLGIPAIADRVVQECMRIVLEPILEAQFFTHSYGFRPMRDAQMAVERIKYIAHQTGYHWIIEGDISKFFDNVNHTTLLRKLYGMGIHDRRVLMIVKAMLQAGIMDEVQTSNIGTPQGGIISPLLANAYLHTLDQWITREWEAKQTRHAYSVSDARIHALRKRSNLKPAYLIRYADDWVLVTDTRSNAEKWKHRIAKFLGTHLKLKLSDEKTLISNLRKRRVQFVGYDIKLVRGNAAKGWITRTYPNEKRLQRVIKRIRGNMRKARKMRQVEEVVQHINLINSQIRGVCNYYQYATWVNPVFAKHADALRRTAWKSLRRHGGKEIPANQLSNLIGVHANYTTKVPAITYQGYYIGITDLSFVTWTRKPVKQPDETPYTPEGREIFRSRTGKRPLQSRVDEMLSLHLLKRLLQGKTRKRYNFEYFLNRAYAFNRDKGRCRVCGLNVDAETVHIHHQQPWLPLNEVNRVSKLATMHEGCHGLIHDGKDYSYLVGTKVWKKILTFREQLVKPDGDMDGTPYEAKVSRTV